MARKTKADAELTRQRLLDAAEQLFSEQGVSNTSLTEIAKAAGLTRGAIYWHFADKVELFDAMHARVALPLEQLEAEILAQDNPLTALSDYWVHALNRLTECEHSRRVVDILLRKCEYVRELEHASDRADQWIRSTLDLMTTAFTLAQRRNYLKDGVEPRAAAIASYGMVIGLLYLWLKQPPLLNMRTDMPRIVGQFFSAMAQPCPLQRASA